MRWLYNLGIMAYGVGVRLMAPFKAKAQQFVDGRRGWEQPLAQALGQDENWVWVHCSSLGEFEQGRPLIEAIKKAHPELKLLLTFFSPSGYNLRRNYPHADHVAYLPLDTPRNARVFLDIVQPILVIHVKYDLWLNYIREVRRRNIHQVLVSAILQPKSKFLRSFLRHEYRVAFQSMGWIFTQDKRTVELLQKFAGDQRVSQAGDTRFDRAAELPRQWMPVEGIEEFIGGRKCIVAGSPWPPDEAILLPAIARLRRPDLCWIIAPHEIHPAQIDRHIAQGGGRMAKYSDLESTTDDTDVLWIDNVGMLSRLYHYATVVYIGGGFGVSIHNTQEPAVYGNPVIFGPKYEKFQEAVDMVKAGGACSVMTTDELVLAFTQWLDFPERVEATRVVNKAYMHSMTGATAAIMNKLHVLHYLPAPGQSVTP